MRITPFNSERFEAACRMPHIALHNALGALGLQTGTSNMASEISKYFGEVALSNP